MITTSDDSDGGDLRGASDSDGASHDLCGSRALYARCNRQQPFPVPHLLAQQWLEKKPVPGLLLHFPYTSSSNSLLWLLKLSHIGLLSVGTISFIGKN